MMPVVFVLSGFRKKNQNFCFFFLNNDDVENCGSFKSFGFICIYRLEYYIKYEILKKKKNYQLVNTLKGRSGPLKTNFGTSSIRMPLFCRLQTMRVGEVFLETQMVQG